MKKWKNLFITDKHIFGIFIFNCAPLFVHFIITHGKSLLAYSFYNFQGDIS